MRTLNGNRKREKQEAAMTRATIRLVLCGALVCLTAVAAPAQTTTTSETKKFQIISVDGNVLVVKLPEGTREMAVADDFRFNVDGQMLSVQQLKPGMSGSATITTKTTVTPVVVTEVKNGTVMQNMGTSILVRTESGMKMFSQADIDKRGIKIWRDGKLAEISDFRANDKLTATIVTTKPPRVMTEREVNATLAQSGGAGAGAAGAGAAGGRRHARGRDSGGVNVKTGTSCGPGCGVVGRRGVGLRAEETAEDRQPLAGSRACGTRVAPRRIGPHPPASSRIALEFANRRRASASAA